MFNIANAVYEQIRNVEENEGVELQNTLEFRLYVVNKTANDLKSIFKKRDDIKDKSIELYKSWKKCSGASDVIKAETTMDAMKKLNAYINKIKEAVTNHKSSLDSANGIVLALTFLQSRLYKIQKVLERG